MIPTVRAAYAEPHRRYHTLAHIEDCLARLAEVTDLSAEDRRILELAIWWHDVVYDPARGDNEERSAELAERDLQGMGEGAAVRSEVARLVRLTKGHEVEGGDRLGALMVSIDLSILGASLEAYERYAAQIRQEYASVPDDAFRMGRAAVLRRFLAAEAIFPDAKLRQRFEGRARANLQRELATLEA